MAEPRREEIAPVYAEFGSACVQAHLLEDALRLLLLASREYAKTQIPDEAIRYPVDPEGIRTLGALFQEVLKVEVIQAQDREFVWRAIRLRNWLIHHYWSGVPTRRMLTPAGRREVTEELWRLGQVLRRATAIVHEMIDRYLTAYGVSVQYFMDQAAGMWVSETLLPGDEELIH